MKFVGIRRVENAGQILKWKYIKSKLEFSVLLKADILSVFSIDKEKVMCYPK